MGDLWRVVADIALELHSNTVTDIAEGISKTTSFADFSNRSREFEKYSQNDAVSKLRESWKELRDVSPEAVAAGLRAAAETAAQTEERESLDLVWTGPSTGTVPCRYTEQVLLEVISSAKDRIFLVSFVGYDVDSVRRSLNEAADRNVSISILLESSKNHGGHLDVDSIGAYRNWVPTANMYTWHPQVSPDSNWNGVVHAKCAVSDGRMAFVTSANLSQAAMERNMELGVLVRGGNLPDKLDRHLAALVATEVVERV